MAFAHYFIRGFARFSRRKRPIRPDDIVLPAKSEPQNAPNIAENPQLTDDFFKEFMSAPRSFLKLPVSELISKLPAKPEISVSEQLKPLETNGALIAHVGTFLPILSSLAKTGSYAESELVVVKMMEVYGVKPDADCMCQLALAYYNGGKTELALQILDKLPKWNVIPQTMFKHMISTALKADRVDDAWSHFQALRHKCVPSPEITGLMMLNCGKTGFVEKGLKLYKEMVASGMEPNPVTHAAMIYLCSRKKEHFNTAIQYYDQMKLLDFPIHLRVHNYMLQGCSKVADVDRAITLWNDLISSKLQPNEISLSSVLWALASAEAMECKISKRAFYYNMKPEEISSIATDIFNQGKNSLGIPYNSHIANGYLAVLCNNLQQAAAEAFFQNGMVDSMQRTQHSYELMFKMYDSLKQLEPAKALKLQMDAEGLVSPFEGWRALIRTAALADRPDLSLQYLKEMLEKGYQPSIDDLRTVFMRVCELRRFDLKPQMEALCLKPPTGPKDVFKGWRQRSVELQKLFNSIYENSPHRPKLATNTERSRN